MKIKENKYLPPRGFTAINLFGVVFVRYGTKLCPWTIRHESIHTNQMKEMFYLSFYLWYGLEWLFRLIQYRNTMDAYYNISFEREAYNNEDSVDYLGSRKRWAWIKYLKRV